MPARVRSARQSLSNCAKAARTPSINFPVDVSSIGSIADRREIPSDCRSERKADKWRLRGTTSTRQSDSLLGISRPRCRPSSLHDGGRPRCPDHHRFSVLAEQFAAARDRNRLRPWFRMLDVLHGHPANSLQTVRDAVECLHCQPARVTGPPKRCLTSIALCVATKERDAARGQNRHDRAETVMAAVRHSGVNGREPG